MNKTIGLTFVAAALLLVASFTTQIYGYHSVTAQRAARRGLPQYSYCDHCETGFESWERAATLIGLLAVSVTMAGAILWDREGQPQASRRSILGLDEITADRICRAVASSKSVVAEEIYVDGSSSRPLAQENLSPLERVIRGY
jgi:hypothetical protein